MVDEEGQKIPPIKPGLNHLLGSATDNAQFCVICGGAVPTKLPEGEIAFVRPNFIKQGADPELEFCTPLTNSEL